eukprot:4768804-Pyramimonas_sp.AAC.1
MKDFIRLGVLAPAELRKSTTKALLLMADNAAGITVTDTAIEDIRRVLAILLETAAMFPDEVGKDAMKLEPALGK